MSSSTPAPSTVTSPVWITRAGHAQRSSGRAAPNCRRNAACQGSDECPRSGLSAWFLAEIGCEVRHPGEDPHAAGRTKALGVALRAMTAAAETDHWHAGGNRSFDSRNTVLNYNARFRCRAQTFGGEQEQIGCRLAVSDLNGAEYVRIEKWQEPGQRETTSDPVEMTVRCNAPRRWQCSEQLFYPSHRRQLELEGGSRPDGEGFKECVGKRSSELGRNRSGEGGAVLPETEDDGFVDRRRKIDRD